MNTYDILAECVRDYIKVQIDNDRCIDSIQ